MTNFATYIDSANPGAPIAQRGHAKQKRNDLSIVGLGPVVSVDGGVPLVSHAYAGNKPDVTQFPVLVNTLVERFQALAGDRDDLTLVFDAGQNSADNYDLLDGSGLHFVGSLPPSDHPDLLGLPRTATGASTASPGCAPSRRPRSSSVSLGGSSCHSAGLHAAQARGFD